MKCENCNKEHDGSYGSGRFCCEKCSRSYSTKNDKNQVKIVQCMSCSKEIEVSKRATASRCKCNECKQKIKEYTNICKICGDYFITKNKNKKYCSKLCRNYALSISTSEYIQKNGTYNFKTKRKKFSYKFIKDIECDSKLEESAIIYLIDIFKAEKIERFKSILNFWKGNFCRKFNPDFYVKKDNKIFIVEVKMIWKPNIDHKYNNHIPQKKESLKSFCKSKGYNMIWLDFNYDKKFKQIYKKWLARQDSNL